MLGAFANDLTFFVLKNKQQDELMALLQRGMDLLSMQDNSQIVKAKALQAIS